MSIIERRVEDIRMAYVRVHSRVAKDTAPTRQSLNTKLPTLSPVHNRSLIQRKPACACGGSCPRCQKNEITAFQQPKSKNTGDSTVSPALAARVQSLQSGGQPLPTSVRTAFEPRFGEDFSSVRIHTDPQSAQDLNARAYTVGTHIVFGAGEYSPQTTAGQKLLAHELTHVVQQGHKVTSVPMTSAISGYDDELEEEADSLANQVVAGNQVTVRRKIATPGTIYRLPISFPILPPGPVIAAIQQLIQLLSASCNPNTALTWADFTGTPPRSTFSALTAFRHDLTTVGTQQAVQAIFRPSASWVKSKYANAGNRAQNGCSTQVRRCEQHFDTQTAAGRTGITYRLGAPTGCAASISPDTSLQATSRGECSSILGTECDRVAQLESARLLRHEQFHFNIACELAKKGTLAILGGADPQRTLRTVRRLANSQTTLYDNQTGHGCNATAQATWEADIQAGLPSISIP